MPNDNNNEEREFNSLAEQDAAEENTTPEGKVVEEVKPAEEVDPKVEEDGLSEEAVKAKAETDIESLSEEEKEFALSKGIIEDNSKEPEEEEKEEEEASDGVVAFMKEVEKLTGEEVTLEDADLETPEGMTKYLDTYSRNQIQKFEDTLKRDYPQAYKALEVAMDGGDVVKYFTESSTSPTDYRQMEIGDEVGLQKEVIREAMLAKGVDAEDIKDLIVNFEDGGRLKDKAVKELAYLQKNQTAKFDSFEAETRESKRATTEKVDSMRDTISSLIDKGNVGEFVIPKTDKKAFMEHTLNSMYYQGGKFHITKEIAPDNLDAVLQQEFFNFKKGNLDGLVKREEKKRYAWRVKGKNKKREGFASSGGNNGDVTLGDV